MVEVDDELLDEVRVAEEPHVACPAQEGVQTALFDAEDDIEAGYFVGLDLAEQVVHHLADYVRLPSVFEVFRQDGRVLLDAGGLVGHVLVLGGGDEGDLVEVVQGPHMARNTDNAGGIALVDNGKGRRPAVVKALQCAFQRVCHMKIGSA